MDAEQISAGTGTSTGTFDLGAWRQRYQHNADAAEQNSLMDSGWSLAVAQLCETVELLLYREIVEALAAVETKAEDFFDRPGLVAIQEAARYACKGRINRRG